MTLNDVKEKNQLMYFETKSYQQTLTSFTFFTLPVKRLCIGSLFLPRLRFYPVSKTNRNGSRYTKSPSDFINALNKASNGNSAFDILELSLCERMIPKTGNP